MAGTLKIIAERAGLSQSTVSQILNRRSNDFSSEKTRQRVFSLAHELGYKQQFGHKLLRGDKTQTVAILLSQHRVSLEEHTQALILRLLDQLESRDYAAYLVTLSPSEDKNLDSIRELLGRGVDSFIFLGHPVGAAALEKYISEADRTLIGYGSGFSRKIIADISNAIAEMIRFFLARGHRNFRFFFGERTDPGRLKGLCKVFPELTREQLLDKYRIHLGYQGKIHDIDEPARFGYQATKQAFEQDPAIDGCLYLSDYFAVGGLRYLMETGRQIGKEVLVAGFNNIHAVRNFPLPVTSAEHDVPRIAEALIEEMTQKGPVERIIPTRTIIRE